MSLRGLVLGCLAALVAVLLCASVHADEVFVLDNGSILRGRVLREDEREIVLRLSGVGGSSEVTIRRERVVRRHTAGVASVSDPSASTPTTPADPVPPPAVVARPRTLPPPEPLDEEGGEDPGFFSRLSKSMGDAFPDDPFKKGLMGALAFLAVVFMLSAGARLTDIEGMTFPRAAMLAGLLAGLGVLDWVYAPVLMRADLAPWVFVVEMVAWVAAVATITRCGGGRATLLLAFVLFSGALFSFAMGAILVSV